MKQLQDGFSAIESLLIVIIIAAVGGIGYYVVNQGHKANATLSSNASSVPTTGNTASLTPNGSTSSIDSLTAQDASSEQSLDTQYTSTDQSASKSADTSTSNVGGSYDESTL